MTNPTAPRGLVPVSGATNQYVTGGVKTYIHDSGDSTALYTGDPVKLTGTSYTINGITVAGVIRATTGDVMVGAVVGILPTTRDSLTYGPASTSYMLMVDDDPNSLFEIQDTATGTPLTANDIGLNVNFVGTGGNTGYGTSNVTLDNTTEATANTLDLKIMGIVNRADNASGDTGPAKFLVRINRHQYVNQIAGV